MEKGFNTAAVLAVVAVLSLIAGTEAAVFKVGDAAGWTIMGNVNYTQWSVSKKFDAGDTVVFTYNKAFHNVLEVSKADYSSCNAASPIATYATGNDSITLKTAGHHYFLCGFPGHCQIGQKVDILIGKSSSSSAAPSMAPASSPGPASELAPGSSHITPSPSPHANSAVSTGFSVSLGLVSIVASLFFV
ncbi:hypothetical protein LUZ60_005257 [Juncus effusus]|nr:hypothetical protein LUZ60_005257 [Juncus effusus]